MTKSIKTVTINFESEKQLLKFINATSSLISDEIDDCTKEGKEFCDIYFKTIFPSIKKSFKSNISNFKDIVKIVNEEVTAFNKNKKDTIIPYKVEVRKNDISIMPETGNYTIWIDDIGNGFIECNKTKNKIFYDTNMFRNSLKSTLKEYAITNSEYDYE